MPPSRTHSSTHSEHWLERLAYHVHSDISHPFHQQTISHLLSTHPPTQYTANIDLQQQYALKYSLTPLTLTIIPTAPFPLLKGSHDEECLCNFRTWHRSMGIE